MTPIRDFDICFTMQTVSKLPIKVYIALIHLYIYIYIYNIYITAVIYLLIR